MRRAGADHWVVDLMLAPGKYQYKFVADGRWEQDVTNSDSEPDGWGGQNSVMTVPPAGANPSRTSTGQSATLSPTPLPVARKEVRWKRISYPDVPVPGAENRTITGLLSGSSPDFDSANARLRFDLLYYEPAGAETPLVLENPEQFTVRRKSLEALSTDG